MELQYNAYKWPYNWVTGVITPINDEKWSYVTPPFITGACAHLVGNTRPPISNHQQASASNCSSEALQAVDIVLRSSVSNQFGGKPWLSKNGRFEVWSLVDGNLRGTPPPTQCQIPPPLRKLAQKRHYGGYNPFFVKHYVLEKFGIGWL